MRKLISMGNFGCDFEVEANFLGDFLFPMRRGGLKKRMEVNFDIGCDTGAKKKTHSISPFLREKKHFHPITSVLIFYYDDQIHKFNQNYISNKR